MASELRASYGAWAASRFRVPAVREEPVPSTPAVPTSWSGSLASELAYVVLQTGVGVNALALEAERLGRTRNLSTGWRSARTLAADRSPRGPSRVSVFAPRTALRLPHDRRAARRVGVDFPWRRGRGGAALRRAQRSGGSGAPEAERGRPGAHALRMAASEDTEPLKRLGERILTGEFHAVAFTTQVQVRHLFAVTDAHLRPALAEALDRRVMTSAPSTTCRTHGPPGPRSRGRRRPPEPQTGAALRGPGFRSRGAARPRARGRRGLTMNRRDHSSTPPPQPSPRRWRGPRCPEWLRSFIDPAPAIPRDRRRRVGRGLASERPRVGQRRTGDRGHEVRHHRANRLLAIVIAHEKGLFKKYGINSTVTKGASWAAIRDSLSNGDIQATHMLIGMPIASTMGLGGAPKKPMIVPWLLNRNGQAITLKTELEGQGRGRSRRR